ncbi:MAG: RipA family octameric membrane protein [Candidatus Heimdallarchaeota archaeon]
MSKKNDSKSEKRLEEYKMCHETLNHESGLFWTRFNILLAVEIFLFSAFAFLVKELFTLDQSSGIFTKIDTWIFYTVIGFFIIIGIGTTFIWYTITEKSSGLTQYFANRMYELEKELEPIDKQTLLNDIFYHSSNIQSKDKRFVFVASFKDNLRWSQKMSISGTVRWLILGFLVIWISIIPMIIHVTLDKWWLTGLIFGIIILSLFMFIILSRSKSKKQKARDKIRNIFKKS